MATEADVKDPISATLNEVEHKEIISDFSNTIINKIVTEEREKVESGTIQPSETVTIFPMKEESLVTNDVEKEKVEIDDEGHTGSTVGEPFLQPPPVVTGLLEKDAGEIQWSLKQGAHSLHEENEGMSNDVIMSVGDGKIEPWQEENSGEGKILVQGHETTGEILEGSKAGAAEQIQEIIESPYAEINTNREKEELVDRVKEAIDEASRINIKITDEQNSLPTANMDEKARTKINYSPNEEESQLEGTDHDRVPSKGQADETFEVHQEEKHVKGNNEAEKGPEGTEKIEITPSTKAPVYEFNEDPEQQEKASNTETETETATDGIERYQTKIEETNAIKELDPSIVLEEEEEERSFKITITTVKEVREPNIECTGQPSDKEFTGVETSNHETLSEGLNKQSHLVTSEGKLTLQEKNIDDGKASSDPEVSENEIEQPTASKDEKALDILEDDKELSNTAPERDKTGSSMLVKDDQLQFEGGSFTVAENEEADFEKHVLASRSSKEGIDIEKRVELDVEAQDNVSEAESNSSNTVTEKVVYYSEGLSIPLEQNIESLDKSKELKLVDGFLSNDGEINITERNNLEESYNNQTGSREEQTTVKDNKGDEIDTKEDIQSSSVGEEELGKIEEKFLTEEVAQTLGEIDENELRKEKTQKEESTEDLHVMPEVNETLKQKTVPDSTTLHDHGAIYFDSRLSEDKITEDLAQHAKELSMSTEFEKESVEAVEKPEDFTTRTSDESREKIKDEKEKQEINDDAPPVIIEETFLAEAQFDHYSVKEADEISCEKHESETTIEMKEGKTTNNDITEFGNIKLAENERASGFDDQVLVMSLEALPGQSAQEIDEVEEIENPKCQDFERVPNVEKPLAHETRLLQIDEDPKDGDNESANKFLDTNDYEEDLEVVPSTESPLVLEESKNTIFEQLVKDTAELKESEIALEFNDQVHGRSFEASQRQSVVEKIKEFEKIEDPQSQDFERVVDVEILDVKTSLPHETGLLHVDPNDGDDDTSNKTVKDYVADLEMAPAIESPLVLEEIKKATLEKPVKKEVHLEESEITTDDQVQEKSLEVFVVQTTSGATDEVKEIEKISEPQCQDFKSVAAVETIDIQTPPAHETGLLKVEENFENGASDTADKGTNIEDYVADLEVVHAIEPPLALEERKEDEKENPENSIKDDVAKEKNETDDRVLDRSLEDLQCTSAQDVGIDDVEDIEKISESQSQDFERTADVETPIARESELLHEDPKDGDDDTVDKVGNTEDSVADIEVVPAIESPLALEESKNATLLKHYKDQAEQKEGQIVLESYDQVHERSLEALTHQSAQGVDKVEEIEKIAEQEFQDLEIVADLETLDVKTPLAHETGLLHVDHNDGDDDINNKTVKDYVTDLKVDPESKKENLEKPVKDEEHLEEITTGCDDQVSKKSLEAFPGQTTPRVDEVEEIEKISETQFQDQIVADDETLDVQIPPAHETGLLHVDPNDEDDDTANKTVKDYEVDLKVAAAPESPLVLEERKKETLEKPVKEEVHLEESEKTTDYQVQEKSLEILVGQTTSGAADEVKEIEKISEPQCQDFKSVAAVETLDIQRPSAHETGLLKLEENFKNGANDTADKGTNIEDYEAELEVVHAIEPPLALKESKEDEKENPENSIKDDVGKEKHETDDRVLDRSLEDLPCTSEQDVGIVKVEEIEKISESQSQDLERIGDDETPIAHESELLHEDPKDGDDDTVDKVGNTEDSVADIEVVPAIESPLALEESKNATLLKLYKDQDEQKEDKIALESYDQVHERSLEALTHQSAQGVDEVEEIEKIAEPEFQDLETLDVKTPLAHETGLLHVDHNDGDDATNSKTVKDYVADLKVAPTIEESKKETLEMPVKDEEHLEEITTGSDGQVSEKSLEAFPGQTTPGVDEVEEIEKISEPQFQDQIVADNETLDVQIPLAHETGLVHVDPNDEDDDTANKTVKDYVVDLKDTPAAESPLVLEESKKETVEKPVKDEAHLEESEITTGSDDQVPERSFETCSSQTTQGVDEIEEIEKISETQCQDFENFADVETPPAHDTGLLKVDENLNGANDTVDKGTNIEDYVTDLEVVHAIDSPLALEESKEIEKENPEKSVKETVDKEKNEMEDRVLERSLEDLQCENAQESGVNEVKEIEKISEPQSQDCERIDDFQTPIAYETELVHVDPKDGDDDTANKVGNPEDYVADLIVVPSIESPLALEESKNTALEKIYKDQAELKEGELALESGDQVQERSLEALTPQSAEGVDEVEEIDKISEPQFQDLEIVADVETLDVKTPLAHKTGLLHVNPNDGNDDTDSKTVKDYVTDLKVSPTTESPFVLEECKKETLGKPVKDEVHLEESEITTASDVQVPETSIEAFPGQTAPGVDEVEEIEKISESQCQHFQRVDDVETLDVQTPPAHETGLLKVDENLNGANDTDYKGKNIEDYVSDLEVVHVIVSPLSLEESKEIEKENSEMSVNDNAEKEKNEKDDQVLERSLEEFPCKSAQDAGVDKVKEIEKISEPQSQDFEQIDDVQTSIAYESEQVHMGLKDGGVDTANKVGNTEDYVADLVVVPAIKSPLELEESKNTTLEKLYKDQAELKEGELALESVDQVQEKPVEALTHQSEQGVHEVEEIEKISEPQFQDLEIVADVETLDVQTPFAHETGLLHVDPNDGDDDTVNKIVKDYVVEPQSQHFERVVNVQTSIAHESELLPVDPRDGDDDTADKVGNSEDSVADLEVVPTIESPLALEESKNATLPKLYKDQAEQKEGEIALEFYDQVHERSLEALTHQSAQGVDEVKDIEKISEPEFQDLEIVADLETLDVKMPLAREAGLLHVDPNDGDDDTNIKTVKDYVTDPKVAPTTESPLVFEEIKKETLENPVKDKVHLEETTGSDDQVSEKLLEAFLGQTTPEVDEVEEIEKISEPQFQDLDVQIPPAHETGLLHIDPNDEDDDTANKTVKDYVVGLKVAPAAESPLVLEESKIETLEKLVKDEVHLEESEITTGSDDQVPEKSLETCPIQTTSGVDEVEEIEKILEPQCEDFERVADVETLPAHDTGLLKVDENVIGANDTTDRGTNIEDSIPDLEVVHAMESPLALEEGKEIEKENREKSVKETVEKENSEMQDRVLERSLEDLQCESAQESEVDEAKEIEKISEPQSQDFERIGDVQSPIAHESESLPVDSKDGDDDIADKVGKTEDSVVDLEVVPVIESPLALEESKNATLSKLHKDQADQKEGEIELESYDQVHERSLEDLTHQSAQGVDEVEEIEKISEPQFQDLEIVAELETLDVKTPLTHETGLLHVDPNDGDDDINSQTGKDYVADLKVAPATESSLVLEESKQETQEKPVKDEVHLEESEMTNESKDQVQERSLEAFSGQTAPEVDEVEKISESHPQDFERIANVETLDVQKPPAHEIGLLNVDENSKNGANDTALKGTNIEDYVADLEVVHAIESPLTMAESNIEKANPENFVKNNVEQEESENNNRVPERSLDVDPKDGDDNTANKDLEVVPTKESPHAQEEEKSTNLEKHPEDKDEMKESEIAPGFDVQVQGRSLEALPRQSAQAVDEVKENEKISELQCQDFERVVDAETFDVQIPPAHETVLLQIDEDPKDGDNDTTNKGVNSTTLEDGETNEDASIINLGTFPQYETGLQGNVVSQEEENKTGTVTEKIEIRDGEKEGTVREGVDEETSKDLEKKFPTQFQGVERVTMSEDDSIINIGTSPHYETRLQGNEVSQAEENETATTIEKIEIQDGVKEAFQGICEQGTVTEGEDGKTSEDVEKKVENQFQDVERVATSEDDSIINVGTSTQYERGLQGKVVSQEEEPETTTTLEKIDIQDGEKEVFQGICEKRTVTEDGYGERNKDVEQKFETQFQDVERVVTSEDASIINVGTSPQYETGLQVNVVSQEEENETEKVEIQNGEKEAFPGIYEQSIVMEVGDGETSEDMEKKFETQFQYIERVATCEDATIINVGISQNESGLLGNVMSQEKKNETTTVTEKIEIQEGEKEAFQGICEQGTVTEGGNGETSEDVEKKFETQFQDVERVATSEYVSTINVGTSPEHETELGMNVVSPKEENETATITTKIEIRDGEKESCEWSKDDSTNQDTKEPISVETKSVGGTYYDELVNPMGEIERDKDMKSTSVKPDLQTGDAETEVSIKPIEVLTTESFEQSKDVCTNHDSKELATIEDKVVTETYHKERGLVNPMEENDGDKDVKSALVTEDLRTGDDDTVVSIKPREVLTKESFEQSKDVCTNQDTKELVNVEDKVVTETYHEEKALVNPMEENNRDKDVKSASVTLDLQTGDNSTEVNIKPTEILTKEEPVELSIMRSEGKLRETNTDSNVLIDNDGENKDQINKSIDSPHAKHSSPNLVNEERNVDEEYEEVTERFTISKPTKLSLSDLMQKSIREAPQVADESIQKKELIDDNQEEKNEGTEIKHGEESKTDEENDEGDEHKGQDSGSDAPVMVEASRDIDTKHTPKKSHNILSGVGSKVKHSIAKVKKVITGKTSPHSKPPSPRIDK